MRVAVTGLAVATPYGRSLDAYWQGLLHGPAPAVRWTPPGFPDLSCLVARLPAAERPDDPAQLAIDLVTRALADAGLAERRDCALALGSHFAESDFVGRDKPAPMLARVLHALQLQGPAVNTPIGCAAGNLSLCWALDRLRGEDARLAVAGGFDVIGAGAAASFDMLGNLSETGARPFDVARDGILLGEGGAMLVLEPLEAALGRGARIYAELVSAACAHDAEHPIRPALDGRGLAEALRRALREGGLEPREVGYVNAHAPGTVVNDPCESAAYRSVFGARGVPVGSTKAAVGHAQGGANGLEAAACVLALQHQVIPPTLGLEQVEPKLELDAVTAARPGPLTVVVSSASAMGGANAVVVLRRASVESSWSAPASFRSPALVSRAEWTASDGEPPKLKRASLAGRALVALARRWAPYPAATGVYQALGAEKLALTEAFAERVLQRGFAGLKATAPVLEYSGYGPFVSLALELECRGPFWTLEADALAGAAALGQAVCDLRLGRCERALVGSCGAGGGAWLLLLEARPSTRWHMTQQWGAPAEGVRPAADDLHGLRALGEALERGETTAVFCETADGRSVVTRFSHS